MKSLAMKAVEMAVIVAMLGGVQAQDVTCKQPRDPATTADVASIFDSAVRAPLTEQCGKPADGYHTYNKDGAFFTITKADSTASSPKDCTTPFDTIIKECVDKNDYYGGEIIADGFLYSVFKHDAEEARSVVAREQVPSEDSPKPSGGPPNPSGGSPNPSGGPPNPSGGSPNPSGGSPNPSEDPTKPREGHKRKGGRKGRKGRKGHKEHKEHKEHKGRPNMTGPDTEPGNGRTRPGGPGGPGSDPSTGPGNSPGHGPGTGPGKGPGSAPGGVPVVDTPKSPTSPTNPTLPSGSPLTKPGSPTTLPADDVSQPAVQPNGPKSPTTDPETPTADVPPTKPKDGAGSSASASPVTSPVTSPVSEA